MALLATCQQAAPLRKISYREGTICARACVCVFVCALQTLTVNDKWQSIRARVPMFLGKGSSCSTRSNAWDVTRGGCQKPSPTTMNFELSLYICDNDIRYSHIEKRLGLTLKNSLPALPLPMSPVCVCEWEQGPLRALMTADDRLRRMALWLMKAAATLRTKGGEVRLWPGGPKRTEDKANDTATSTFNTCLTNTLEDREELWNTTQLK